MSGGSAAARPVALVMGAASKVGSTIARRLAADGFAVAGIDIVDSDTSLALVADATNEAALGTAVARVTAKLGPIDVLVTGLGEPASAEFTALDGARWRLLLDSHLRAATNACRAVLPGMLAARRGTVVTLATHAALFGGGSSEAYEAAAAGTIIGFTKSVAVEMAPHGIRVNCVAAPRDGSGGAVTDTVAFLAREGDFYVGQVFIPSAGKEDTNAQ
jgi:2-hydroxycyclohexanecarboxyl-CoA dehydrogenase